MATLIPDTPKDCTASERLVFERFERDLRDHPDWVIFHSLGLSDHQKKLWGEVDFVVVSTKGIFVLEVKGGSVACKDGKWTYGSGSNSYTKVESPWAQAGSAMFALQARLEKAEPALGRLLMGFGVVMPREIFLATGPEIEQGTLLDRREFSRNLGFYVGRLQRHWERVYRERHGADPALPTEEHVRQIRALLRPDVDSSIRLGGELNGLDRELIQLTNRQIRASRRMAANPRSVVRGRAGTGKTILAVERAKQLAEQGQKVLYLCFNKMLAFHVAENLRKEGIGSIEARHIHSLYRGVIELAGRQGALAIDGVAEGELFGRIYPQTFVDAALDVDLEPFDVVLVDEAQDLMTPEHLDAIDILVKDGLNRGNWHFFLDPLQNIYQVEEEAVNARLEGVAIVYDDLYENCRNTRQVAQQVSIMSGIDMAIEGAIEGVPCECRFYVDKDEGVRMLDEEISRLLREGVNASDIVILSTRKRENSMVADLPQLGGRPVRDLTPGNIVDGIAFSTMHAFKGLERNVVIAVDIEELGRPEVSMLHYAGLSRARTLLIPFLKSSSRPQYEQQAVAFGRRLATGLERVA